MTEKFKKQTPKAWEDFNRSRWVDDLDIADFIRSNIKSFDGDESFLEGPTEKTKILNSKLQKLLKEEVKRNCVYEIENNNPTGINTHQPGYLDKEAEEIVGLQTDAPLKQAFNPYGGIRMANKGVIEAHKEVDKEMTHIFSDLTETHNEGVYNIYNDEMKRVKHNKLITGLPDTYGRGRIIPDYPRIALYGMDKLIELRKEDLAGIGAGEMTPEIMQLRHEVSLQIKAMYEIIEMANSYGFDIRRPAETAKEAIQWVYFGYLASIKSENGAAMSVGRLDSFFDIYIERDIKRGILSEQGAQELVDHFVNRLRMVRFARPDAYNQLFSGQPIWATLSIGGTTMNGQSLVSKTTYRVLNTLYTMGTSPEPNITVLWSSSLPESFRTYVAKVAVDTSAIQIENDDLLKSTWGTDYYGIACCVSAQPIATGVQFFGARANLAKAVLYTINGGVDEITHAQVSPEFQAIPGDYIDYDLFMERFEQMTDWLAGIYINTLNVIHYSHDRFYYEKASMAFKDVYLDRSFATGISGFSHAVDSISAIKYGHVRMIRNEDGLVVDYEAENDFPRYGNDDDRVDDIACRLVKSFYEKMNKHIRYRNAKLTTSILTITSNVVYGENTGTTPDGRQAGHPFAPGANSSYGAAVHGALADLRSTSKLPYRYSTDGISNTFGIVPTSLGVDGRMRKENLRDVISGYMADGGMHLNLNIMNRELLLDAQKHPEEYPNLTIRVSGYAVLFNKLTRKQQNDVISRTFHERI